ncbi:glycosyltransferase family 4 protein [Enterobacter kobei]|uniref:glycosyltransferase family 4 protein n=1 Tax=Enterobacter kobei TaxID=208224 RepID=UPI002005DAFA|nr:glycosyltransferase family 4 protein [Enterobacter kobei]MCK7154291.1 glycosyltransferase family 4 protein [Enterobacter kobei]MCK7214777.1 glycosyltransferase family 4 protein [Enterobacter kobei]HCM9091103.1 glycosyltransferase family 4 protein [Enterobacter kobei]HCM9165930.1 glycosyltransferase family 4 protein [Enterobacter kobei]HDZ8317479.1 glycosyltransferase family 4 protein [Enterobacter kobei]
MQNKTIAITANTCWYIYNFRKNTILTLLDEGYDVIACAPFDKYTYLLESLGCRYQEVKIDKSGLNPLKDIYTIYNFYKIFKNANVDVVLNFTPKNNIYSTFAAKICKIKVINNIAGLGTAFGSAGLLNFIVRNLYKYSQKEADFIFFQNIEDYSIFRQLGINKLSMDILPGSGVDLKRFAFKQSTNDGIIRFAVIARMLIDKGIVQYVDAARLLKAKYRDSVEFSLIGFIDDLNPRSISSGKMKEWVEEGHVKYLGASDNIEKIIGDVDCVVLPSFYREGVPKSLLEAAAMGKPIITTDNVGCREALENGKTGYLCQPRSVSDLCSKMELIINLSLEDRIAMGKAGREFIEKKFDEKIVIKKYLTALQTVLYK